MLERELGSQVLPNVAEILWEASDGNPLLLNGLIDDAKKRRHAAAAQRGVAARRGPSTATGTA